MLRGDQVVYATVAAEGFSICFRDVADWATPSCQAFSVDGVPDPRAATAALSVGADWVLVTPRWGAGSQANLVVDGTTAPDVPVPVVAPDADRVSVFAVGDSARPLASVWKGTIGYIGQVDTHGTVIEALHPPHHPGGRHRAAADGRPVDRPRRPHRRRCGRLPGVAAHR